MSAIAEKVFLTDEDRMWLHSLRISEPDDGPDFINELNELLGRDHRLSNGQDQADSALVAHYRKQFYSLMGFPTEALIGDKPTLAPLATSISSIRKLVSLVPNVDVAHVLEKFPHFLVLSPESLHNKIENLEKLVPGLDIPRAIGTNPMILSYAMDTVKDKIDNLLRLVPGIDLARILKNHSDVLGKSKSSPQLKLDNLVRLVPGVDIDKVVNSYPPILYLGEESIEEKINNLVDLVPGVDVAKVINSLPSFLGAAPESVRERIELLQVLVPGVDLAKVINSHPAFLSYAPESIWLKIMLTQQLHPERLESFCSPTNDLAKDKRDIAGIFITPIETTLLALAYNIPTEHVRRMKDAVAKLTGCITRKQRKELLADLQNDYSDNPDPLDNIGSNIGMLGPVALVLSGNNGSHVRMDKDDPWRFQPAKEL